MNVVFARITEGPVYRHHFRSSLLVEKSNPDKRWKLFGFASGISVFSNSVSCCLWLSFFFHLKLTPEH